MINRSTLVGRLVLLTAATFVALAPLCSTVIAAPEGSGVTALEGAHAMGSAQHGSPVATTTVSSVHHGQHCALHSCCAAGLVKTARLKNSAGTAVSAVVAQTATESADSCWIANVAGPTATTGAAGANAPLRL